MYDSFIYCKEYKELKNHIIDCMNGEIQNYDIDEIENRIQELYNNGEMKASQYDNLMSYLLDL